jgi:hypothetical protein
MFTQDNAFSGTVKVEENVANLQDVPRGYIDEVEEHEWNTQPPTLKNVIRNELVPQFGKTIVPGTDFVLREKASAFNHIFHDRPVEVIEPLRRPVEVVEPFRRPIEIVEPRRASPPFAAPVYQNFNAVRGRPGF